MIFLKQKQFKSESNRLLDLMINSIYTNKDIFLRELISNSSDAIDKLYYRSLTDKSFKIKKDDLDIKIDIDTDKKIISIEDNGCGMTEKELENNLSTIAKSGSLAFKNIEKTNNKIDIIGQFGVGFYSAFMVSDKIEVDSKSVDEESAHKWISSGKEGYTITESEKKTNGTIIKLYIKDDTENYKYSMYLDSYNIINLIKKYSDYIRYPIKLLNKDNDNKEFKVINSMIPIWKKNKKDLTEDEINNYYKDKFYDYENPLKVINSKVEGICSYNAFLFIPSHAPMDYYTKDYEKGLSLYSNGILIMDKCSDLLPDYFSFIKGVVDTEDVSLNISRELLQKTKNLNIIAKNIENKIKKELESMLENDRENYKKLFKEFGVQLKYGVYNNYGVDKDKLKDLIMFYSSTKKDLITLKEYVMDMKKNQKYIYYACGENIGKIDQLPQTEKIKSLGYEILYLPDYVDEFALNAIIDVEGKKFMNVSSENLDIENEQEKEKTKKINEDNKDLLSIMKDTLKLTEVKFTNKLVNHPVCLSAKGKLSIEMEKVINSLPTDEKLSAEIVLEINEKHPIADKLKKLYSTDIEELKKYSKILYNEARLIEGLPIENPTEISNLICEVISK